MGCTKYSDPEHDRPGPKAYFSYIISDEGQQVAAENAGSAPIPPGIKKERPAGDRRDRRLIQGGGGGPAPRRGASGRFST